VHGLWKEFEDIINKNLTIIATAHGVQTRPAQFKKMTDIAPILNLVVHLDQGKVTSLEWRNSCYDD